MSMKKVSKKLFKSVISTYVNARLDSSNIDIEAMVFAFAVSQDR